MRRKGARSAVLFCPIPLPAHEKKIDHGAPGAKRRHHFREVTKMVIPPTYQGPPPPPYPSPIPPLHLQKTTRAPYNPRLREWLFKDNYTLTIMVLILIFLLILFLKKVCFFLVRFGLFWFNLVFSKPIWKSKNQFGLICFSLVYFGFNLSKIFIIDKKFTNFLLTFCKF